MELQRLAFFGTLLLILGFCHYYDKSVEVNGLVECSECSQDNIESAEVLSGHQILISCKVDDEQFKTRGIGEVKDGKFKVAISNEIVDNNGQLREECFAQLKSISSDITCPSFDDELEVSKVVNQSIENGKHILGTKGKLDISPNACNSAFLREAMTNQPAGERRTHRRGRRGPTGGKAVCDSHQWEKTTNAGRKRAAAPAGVDSWRRQAGSGGARAGSHKESPQHSNDRRDTDHGGRTTDLQCIRREMDAEAVAGEKKTKRDLKEMDEGWGLKLGFVAGKGKM
ncbi:hypothetical protein Scep_002240 [Stephania cephalantha]|uniref:Uncharacterized protein n=1 Tax=Stephania cephalantha TaxID=152367 RepID=A0AAP0Q5S6_9MAGN